MNDCIFCKIINGEIPSYKVFENDEFLVILDAFPAAKGHTLVLPKNHIENIFEIDKSLAGRMFELVTVVANAMKSSLELNANSINILQNNGKEAGQLVPHFHIHLIPRFENDNIQIKWESSKSDEEIAKKIAQSIAID